MQATIPSEEEIRAAARSLDGRVIRTPVFHWQSRRKDELVGGGTEVFLKMELFQYGGSFKLRGALLSMMALSPEALQRGVTAVSAGNHAIAVSTAADALGTSTKVVMPSNANRYRIEQCRQLGAEVVLVENVSEAFAEVERIQKEEGRSFIHPFEGPLVALGTASLGLEFADQAANLDALIIPIGGGGLAAGMASAFSRVQPACKLYGVEPFGADSMYRSFQSGVPESIPSVKTIADSLGAPFALPYSFSLCRQLLEGVDRVDDKAIRMSMRLMAEEHKVAVEPAGAAALAALLGPLREQLHNQRVGIVVCGANLDADSFSQQISGVPDWA